MTFPAGLERLPRGTLLVAAVLSALLAPLAATAAPVRDVRVPSATAVPLLPAFAAGEPERVRVAQSREAAQLQLQIQQLEEQIRLLTGQVEGLQFQMTQMQTLIERMTADNEFRFQQLEGGAGTPPPPGPSGAVTQPGAGAADPTTTASTSEGPAPAVPEVDAAGEPMDDVALGEPMHALDSADPLLGGGTPELGTLEGRPLDLSLDGGSEVSNGDAAAQYAAGYDAIVRGDYAFAEEQFQQFIALYPDDPQAPDATNWLGEALMQRGAFDEAALVLAEGYQKYQASPRAPDLMLKLGIALNGAGEAEVACRTFSTLEQRFTGLPPAFVQRLTEEKSRAQCPA